MALALQQHNQVTETPSRSGGYVWDEKLVDRRCLVENIGLMDHVGE